MTSGEGDDSRDGDGIGCVTVGDGSSSSKRGLCNTSSLS